MRVFITGATGYIGGAVSELLVQRGHEVAGLVRTEQAAERLQARGVEPVLGDLHNLDVLVRTTQGADGVINAATTYGMDRGEVEAAAVGAMLAALGDRQRPFVYTSDQLIYGNTGATPAEESRPLTPPSFLTWRPEVERMVIEQPGVRGVALRATAVYGRGGNQLFPGWIAAAAQAGAAGYVADGSVSWSFVHVDDLARAYALALENTQARSIYNVADEPAVPLVDLARAIATAAGVAGRTRSLSVEEATGIFGPAASLFAEAHLVVSARRIREELGWSPAAPSVLEDLTSGSYVSAAP